MIEIRYIFLHIIVIVILILYCRKITTDNTKSYWKLALSPILIFSLEEGLRWGREIDWCVYSEVYENLKKGVDTGHEWLFTLIWTFFGAMDIPYYILITFCSFLLVYSIFYFCKPYKDIIYLAVPFIVIVSAGNATNLIRWYMGVSMLLIACRSYLDGYIRKAIVFIVAACSIHLGLLFAVLIMSCSLLSKKKWMRAETAIVISIALIFLFDHRILGQFAFLFNLLGGRFANYAGEGIGWIIGTASKKESVFLSATDIVLSSIPLWCIIFYGAKFIRMNVKLAPLYNTMVIGIFIKNMSRGLELIGRYAYIYEIFIWLFGAYSFQYLYRKGRNRTFIDNFALLIILVFVIRKVFVFCYPPYSRPELLQYIWDMQTDPSVLIYQYYMNL